MMRGYLVISILLFSNCAVESMSFRTALRGISAVLMQQKRALQVQLSTQAQQRLDQTEAYFSVVTKDNIARSVEKMPGHKINDRLLSLLDPSRVYYHDKEFFDAIIATGKQHPDHYYVIHGFTKWLCPLHDFYTIFASTDKKYNLKHYVGIRTLSALHTKYVPEYLRRCKEIYDHQKLEKTELLSVNLSAYGHILPGESSYYYAISDRNNDIPDCLVAIYMHDIGITDSQVIEYVTKKMYSIKALLNADKGGMLQILIPRTKIDQYVYLSAAYGKAIRSKIDLSDKTLLQDGFDEQEGCYTQISPFLRMYTESPALLRDYMPRAQARLLMHKDLADPSSGIKMVRHLFVSQEKLDAYMQEIKKLVVEVKALMQKK